VDEVGGAIERVDDPGIHSRRACWRKRRFLAQEGVVRVGFGQHFDDGLFGGLVDVGDEVVVFFSVTTRGRGQEARLMTAAARRAALIAVLSIGCMELPLKTRPPARLSGAGTMECKNELKSGAVPKWLKSRPGVSVL
jgi:hypothetical protein